MMSRIFALISSCCLIIIANQGCRSVKSVEEQLASMQLDSSYLVGKQTVYLTGIKPIENVNSVDKLTFDIWKIDANKYPKIIQLYARVFDSTGNFITNLATPVRSDNKAWKALSEKLGRRVTDIDSFTVREYGAGDGIGYGINLMIDYSGSMNGVLDALYEGTELFIGLKQPQDKIALSTFNKTYDLKVPYLTDRTELLTQFRKRRDKGFGQYSALYDALSSAVRSFDSIPPGMPRVLVVFTDGDDNFSSIKTSTLFKEAKNRDVQIFTVGFGYSMSDELSYISKNTGGKFYQIYSKKDLVNVFKEIYQSLRNYYLITYKPPTFSGLHTVSLTLQPPGRTDTLWATGQYDKSDLDQFAEISDSFSKRIIFEYNKSQLRQESSYIIEELFDQLERRPRIWLEVQGHTDNIGGEEFNARLSQARAQAVVDELVKRGINAKRLSPRGMGMLYPLMSNETEEGRSLNRRTEFKVIRK